MDRRTKRLIALLAMLFVSVSLFAIDLPNAQEYEVTEFPSWTIELRRAETIFFGSLPLTLPVTSFAMNLMTKGEPNFWTNMGIACSISAVIALVDWILGRR